MIQLFETRKMKTILVFVSTLDGKVTRWGNPDVRLWSSQSDKQYFNKLWNDTRLIVMGSTTYNVTPVKSSSKHHIVIMTHNPSAYKGAGKLGELEFTDESPENLFARFEKAGHELMLVVGGAQVATSFLKQQLIDELWLTTEPKIFGSGGNFVIEEKLDIDLKLISSERINEQGTLINKYKVIKNNIMP
jgi:dihydrofolate reductase